MPNYEDAGVNVNEADKGIAKMVTHLARTWTQETPGRVEGFGSFATMLNLNDSQLLAWSTDGVGSKTIIADMIGVYDTIGIDCVAANVNDVICVGARPMSLLDYLAVDAADADMIADIGKGLVAGAIEARISISGGEISQLPDNLTGFDLAGTACGLVERRKIILGEDIEDGDAIIGIASSGIHCNGMSLARRVLFKENGLQPDEHFEEFGSTLGMELLKPTAIYVRPVMNLLAELPIHGLANITGDGLLNLNRLWVPDGLRFYIDNLPTPQEIFKMIQLMGKLDEKTMYQTFNMGVGFCVVLDERYTEDAINICYKHGMDAAKIGNVVKGKYKSVQLAQPGLVGREKVFEHK